MDLETASGPEVGHALSGFGINMLVRNTRRTAEFLTQVLGFEDIRVAQDYALLRRGSQVVQLHPDETYAENPLLSLLPEAGARGAGVELRLFDLDPDVAEAQAREGGYTVLRESRDRPHGLRECFLLDPDGYCWVPSRKI